jgi:DNA-binding transcriptional MerR regulator
VLAEIPEIPEIRAALDALPEKTYYRIGEVAKLTEVREYVLRFWESEFSVIAPTKSRAGQRMYRRRDIETILLIKHLLHTQGYTIKGARRYLADLGRPELDAAPALDLAELRRELEELRGMLSRS